MRYKKLDLRNANLFYRAHDLQNICFLNQNSLYILLTYIISIVPVYSELEVPVIVTLLNIFFYQALVH